MGLFDSFSSIFNRQFGDLGSIGDKGSITGEVRVDQPVNTGSALAQQELLMQLLGQIPQLGGAFQQLLSQGSGLLNQGQGFRDIASNLLGITQEDRLGTNLGFAKTQADRQVSELQRQLTASQVDRGQANAGFSQTQQNAASSATRGALFDNAFARSFQEALQSNQLGTQVGALGNQTTQLGSSLIGGLGQQQGLFSTQLTDLISKLLVAGTQGASQSFVARQNARAGLNNAAFGEGISNFGL